ncbi:MAG: methyltransferase domain-containing protein [Chloroflexota bacterium]|nr:methyltransferase domain-containing protein [Chloroflexota bacterium]
MKTPRIAQLANAIYTRLQKIMGSDPLSLNNAMVDDLKARGLIRSEAVEAAFRATPRHLFLPATPLDQVYNDEPVVTRYNERKQPISSSSQPAIMAIMLELLGLQPGMRVLEIGAGTGYNAALMAHIVGSAGSVVTVDIDEEVIDEARTRLNNAGAAAVQTIRGDGALGYLPAAPYDRIILTVGAHDIALAWRDQLREGGLLVLPLSLRYTPRVFAFERQGDLMRSVHITSGGFMPLRGQGAPAEQTYPLPEHDGISFWHDGAALIDLPALAQTFSAAQRSFNTHVTADTLSTWSGWSLWLELHDPAFTLLLVDRPDARSSQFAAFAESAQFAVVTPPEAHGERAGQIELHVRCYGESDTLAQRLIARLRDWRTAGSPRLERELYVTAFPLEAKIKLPASALRIVKAQMQYIITIDTETLS